MEILVVGGTGTVGSDVVRQLLERGESPRVLVRSERKGQELPEGARGVVGDLTQPASLGDAFSGTDAVFLLNALSQTETEQGLAAVTAARRGGARAIVYLSVAMPEGSQHIPHFASKIPVEQAVRDSGTEWTILRPNNFYQNDLALREAIVTHGVYPQPIGSKGMSRVDVRDIAEAAVEALTDGESGREIPLHGPDALTGEETARIYSRNLGREVRYGGDDLDAWERQVRPLMPEWLVRDLRIMYEYFQDRGFRAAEEDLAAEEEILGHAPRSFEAFVAELAPTWRRP